MTVKYPPIDRRAWLESRSEVLQITTCSCRVCHNYHTDKERNMTVCSQCELPSAGHREYHPDCLFCGEQFTLQVFHWGDSQKIHYCMNCGGDNDARMG